MTEHWERVSQQVGRVTASCPDNHKPARACGGCAEWTTQALQGTQVGA